MVFFFPLMVVIVFVLWVVGKNTPPPSDEIVLQIKLDIEPEDGKPQTITFK